MTIQITGYDIIDCSMGRDENHLTFKGIVHLESNHEPVDVAFHGEHEVGMTGFSQFDLQEPDQIDIPTIRERADMVRDSLAEHVLLYGFSTGEYTKGTKVH